MQPSPTTRSRGGSRQLCERAQQSLDSGIYMTPSNGWDCIVSTPHADSDMQQLLEAADQACSDRTCSELA